MTFLSPDKFVILQVEKALVPRSVATQQAFANLIDMHERAIANHSATDTSTSGDQNGGPENGYRAGNDNSANLR